MLTPKANGSGDLTLAVNVSAFTRRTARAENILGVALTYTGPFSGRPQDEIGIGFGSARANDRLSGAVKEANRIDGGSRPVPDREYVLEAYYGVRVMNGLMLKPGFQYIIDPGGIRGHENALVPSIKTTISF